MHACIHCLSHTILAVYVGLAQAQVWCCPPLLSMQRGGQHQTNEVSVIFGQSLALPAIVILKKHDMKRSRNKERNSDPIWGSNHRLLNCKIPFISPSYHRLLGTLFVFHYLNAVNVKYFVVYCLTHI